MRRWTDALAALPWRGLFWAAWSGITVLALIPWSRKMPEVFQWSDKLNHFLAFVLLACLLMIAYRPGWLKGWALLFLYGAAIEGVQSFLPWRSAEWGDLAVDAVAAAVGLASYRALLLLLPEGWGSAESASK